MDEDYRRTLERAIRYLCNGADAVCDDMKLNRGVPRFNYMAPGPGRALSRCRPRNSQSSYFQLSHRWRCRAARNLGTNETCRDRQAPSRPVPAGRCHAIWQLLDRRMSLSRDVGRLAGSFSQPINLIWSVGRIVPIMEPSLAGDQVLIVRFAVAMATRSHFSKAAIRVPLRNPDERTRK